ncbi:MAG: GNAT family N-acetyltransferase [Candidatus Riflebacteria bacterium]|nr:GNAT family N-acetyltransferase [Candidatus Riflebacteria bacterium]
MITTERLKIYPISLDKMREIVENEKNEILKIAYKEMLDGCVNHPENHIWYTLWFMELKNSKNEIVGTLSFKGIDEKGVVEIGYGINDGYENKGYTTEAVKALSEWASKQPNVKQIEAETEETNIASIRVLEKSNFVPNGIMGQEGPRFVWKSKDLLK